MATILVTFFTLLMVTFFNDTPLEHVPSFLPYTALISGILFFLSIFLSAILSLQAVHPRKALLSIALRILRKDGTIYLAKGILCFYFFGSLVLFVLAPSVHHLMLLGWFFLLGPVVDAFFFLIHRINAYADPDFQVKRFSQMFLSILKSGNGDKAQRCIESFLQAVSCAIFKKQSAFGLIYIDALQQNMQLYIKALAQVNDPSKETTPLLDRVQYMAMYFCRNLEWLCSIAVREFELPIAERTIQELSKMSIFLLQQHASLASLPLASMKKCTEFAFEHSEELITHTMLALSSIIQEFLRVAKAGKLDLKELLLLSVGYLEDIAEFAFRKNKEINPLLLMQPFAEVVEVLGSPGYEELAGREQLIIEIRRILGTFQSIELVRKNEDLMGLSGTTPDSTASYSEERI